MPEFLNQALSDAESLEPVSILIRLLASSFFGLLVAGIYRYTRSAAEVSPSFSTTLILLCILIAMVTQVIGDNIARAFSLVGALSIVRFRTVVRDTEDTAYVIFAVVTGMAVGSHHLWTAVLGMLVVAGTALWMKSQVGKRDDGPSYVLTLRLASGLKPEDLPAEIIDQPFLSRRIASIATSRMGSAVEYIYEIRLAPDVEPDFLVRGLNRQEGVQNVEIRRGDFDT